MAIHQGLEEEALSGMEGTQMEVHEALAAAAADRAAPLT